ncbi:MAG: hypothetical protein PVH29_10640 [Candidatus Zixiibacteriota bacterium]|jgi:endonuclease III
MGSLYLVERPKYSERRKKIVRILLDYRKNLKIGDYVEDEVVNAFIKNDEFAWFTFVLLSGNQNVERAWLFPYELSQRLENNLSPRRVADLSLSKLDKIFGEIADAGYALRFRLTASASLLRAAEKIVGEYDGDVKRIWLDSSSPGELIRVFEEFYGIGQKKASMAVNMLIGLGWVKFPESRLSETEISNDKHIRRIFLRTGLIDGLVKKDIITPVSDSEKLGKAIIEAAKFLNPRNPGALDLPAWYIGREYCFNIGPNCRRCVLKNVCAKNTSRTG